MIAILSFNEVRSLRKLYRRGSLLFVGSPERIFDKSISFMVALRGLIAGDKSEPIEDEGTTGCFTGLKSSVLIVSDLLRISGNESLLTLRDCFRVSVRSSSAYFGTFLERKWITERDRLSERDIGLGLTERARLSLSSTRKVRDDFLFRFLILSFDPKEFGWTLRGKGYDKLSVRRWKVREDIFNDKS